MTRAVTESGLRLCPALPSDARLLWRWANDPEVRRHAFHPEPIPWETHERWFSDRLRDERCLIAIGELDSVGPPGQVRFDERPQELDAVMHAANSGCR